MMIQVHPLTLCNEFTQTLDCEKFKDCIRPNMELLKVEVVEGRGGEWEEEEE